MQTYELLRAAGGKTKRLSNVFPQSLVPITSTASVLQQDLWCDFPAYAPTGFLMSNHITDLIQWTVYLHPVPSRGDLVRSLAVEGISDGVLDSSAAHMSAPELQGWLAGRL